MPEYVPFLALAAVTTAIGLLLLGLIRFDVRHRQHAPRH
jgi:hypothetical protein